MNVVRVVALNTAREILRDRILYGLLVFATLLVLVSILLGELSFTEQERIITDFGLLASNVGCAFLAIFIGSNLVWKEIEKQTVLLLISKPVKRTQFLMGKFLGLTIVIVLVDLLISGLLALLCLRFSGMHWWPFLISQFGVVCESLVLLATVMFFGVFCKPVMTVVFGISLWFVGHGLDDLKFFSQKSDSQLFKSFGEVVTRILPNFNKFNFREAVIYNDVIPPQSILHAALLALAWLSVLLIASSWIFERRDFI